MRTEKAPVVHERCVVFLPDRKHGATPVIAGPAQSPSAEKEPTSGISWQADL